MGLRTYRAKRNFRVTPEPRGKKAAGGAAATLSFVVQKHAASHLHYDFRLEWNGVLLSWAIPKGPSLDPADKRLAIHVEDHPLEYGGFEGIIPERQYGAGTVMLWDRGTWIPRGDPEAGHAKGHLKFTLDGTKLRGGWTLVRTRGGQYGGKTGDQAWLLIKEDDQYAKTGAASIVDTATQSAATARSLEQIARARSHVWQSKLSVKANLRAGAIAPAGPHSPVTKAPGSRVRGAKKARTPQTLSPVLATLVAGAPKGTEWIHEIKYDGYRMVCRIERGKARLFSRSGKEWTASFPSVVRDLAALPVTSAWVDGEIVVMASGGKTSFQALQNALSSSSGAAFTFFAFDLPYLDGYDLRAVVLTERKLRLREVLGGGVGTVRLGPEAPGSGEEFLRQACAMGLEGIVCKKADSLYRDGMRSREWVKVKCIQRQEMVIGGYTDPQRSRTGFGALLLGYHERGQLRYSGKVGTGFDERSLRTLLPQLKKREQAASPFVDPPHGFEAKGAHWIKPDLVAEVAFTEWSNDGALRHPSFQGLRMDKKATEVVRETPTGLDALIGEGKRRNKASPASLPGEAAVHVAGIALSNPDKPYFPEAGITKCDLAEYYEHVAPWLLPHIKDRPLSLVRCPDGWPKECFYQKHADASVSPAASRIEVPEGKGKATYLGARSAKALAGLVQWGVIELHPWGSHTPRLDRPDRLVFDFDPDERVAWKDVATAVGLLRTLLDEVQLAGFLKTTGGKGLHVVVPIRPTLSWKQAKTFSKGVADFLARTFPDRFTVALAKERRKGKIFIDYLRNAEGATAVAPYAVRARSNAPVATPIDWKELARDVRFDYFNLRNIPQRLSKMKTDPWADFLGVRQTITAALQKQFG